MTLFLVYIPERFLEPGVSRDRVPIQSPLKTTMSYINYTIYTDAIGEYTLRREGPDFEDFPGSVPPFGVEAGLSPLPPTSPPTAAPSKLILLIKITQC